MTTKTPAGRVVITQAEIRLEDGRLAATVDQVPIGGGSRVVTVDGVPEERVDPFRIAVHVRLIAPDRMIPDQLREVETFEEGTALGLAYAEKLVEHAANIDALAKDLDL